jgi:signal transduction histidine kinase/ActR/RegA family two-component response regulator
MIEPQTDGNSTSHPPLRSNSDIAIHEAAPRPDWSHMSDSEHFVQFYEADAFLLDSLSGYVGTALSAGEAAVVIATKARREGLEARLREQGLDVAAASASGQYVSLDAAETLSKFMVDGVPEPKRFTEAVGSILLSATDGRARVRAFGEMVALLWAEGNYAAAIRLEELWNNLQHTHSFSLFCAYPMNGFGGEEFAGQLGNVCAGHSRVIPAESYTALTNTDERLRTITLLQQKASTLQAEIAERKEAEERLQTALMQEQLARAEAENANRLKDEFLATVSHELRTPLNAIIGWSEMLRNGVLDEATAARAIETIARNAASQAQLVEDILDVSRVITGKLRLNIGPVDAAAVINAAIDSVELAAEAKGIQLEVILDPSARRVAGDASRLQQVVWNLLSNAIKFTPSNGRVRVRLERAADANVQIKVSDTGCGISPEFLPFIFDRFRQADGSSTRRHGGLGLGLAIVRHLIELHGGTVHAESDGEGCGTTFTIRLPLAPAQERAAKNRGRDAVGLWPDEATMAHVKPFPSLDGVQVLVVDDDPDSLQVMGVMLTKQRANVQTVSSVAEALEVLQWYRPDVLVSDLAMPDEDGYALIRKVRALETPRDKRIPAVALTAYVRIEDRARALSAGFNMFVPKPIEPSELITAIANLVQSEAGN